MIECDKSLDYLKRVEASTVPEVFIIIDTFAIIHE